jgi:uracil-DNA glycosylase
MDASVRPDARKTLVELREEWRSCTRCELGQRRITVGGEFVFGQGVTGSIMLIGEGPGVEEEQQGVPFVGNKSGGTLLRRILEKLGMNEVYITNLVSCRSCTPQVDGSGQPVFRKNYRTKQLELAYKDEPPTPPQYLACAPRLYEEVYLVDPVVIVGLGGKACEALLGRPITITRDRGKTHQIYVPGASYAPNLTEKKQEWARKNKLGLTTPTEQNLVRYHFIPTLHPAYVIRTLEDQSPNSTFRQLVADLRRAQKTYETYCEMVYGIVPTRRDEDTDTSDHDLHQQMFEEGRTEE